MIVRRKMLLILFLPALLLTACSTGTRFAYDHLQTLARWELGSYVELSADQKTAFDREFKPLQAWHRRTQLPLYAADLRRTAALFESGNPDAAAIAEVRKRIEAHGDALFDEARPRLVRLLVLLDDEQIAAGLAHQRKENDEGLRKLEKRDPAARRKAELKERVDGIEEWLGPLSAEQKARLGSELDEDMSRGALDPDRRRARATREQTQIADLLAHRRDADFERRLETFGDPTDAAQAQREADATARNGQRFVDFMQTLDGKQRQHLRKRLLGFAEDCDALAAEAAP